MKHFLLDEPGKLIMLNTKALARHVSDFALNIIWQMKNFQRGEPWEPFLLNTSALARLLCPLFRLETTMSMHCIRIGIFVKPKDHKVMEF